MKVDLIGIGKVKAGDILGKPGIYNYDWGETELDKMIHLEVFTFDDVAGFQQKAKDAYTKNPESMSEEEKAARPKENLLIIPPNDKRYTKEANTDPEAKAVFHELPETRKEYYKKVVQPLKKLDKIKDQEGKEYICIAKQGIEVYVEYKKEYETHGITLEAFTVIDKAGADKIGIFEDISKFYHPNPEEDETAEQDKEQLNETFKEILKNIQLDENADGRLEAGEFAGLSLNPDRREQLSYFAVKHESEWDGDVSRYQDIITYLESDPRLKPNELMFKDRVEKLALWPKQILGQSATPTFFHPIALISVFQVSAELITKEMLNAMCLGSGNNQALLDALNKYCPQYEINTPLRIAHFLSQAAHESECFSKFIEDDSYQESKALGCSTYKRYRESPAGQNIILRKNSKGKLICKQPEYFNCKYAGSNGNGNFNSGDGHKFRGRGLIHITGREKYQGFTNEYNSNNPSEQQDFIENPDLVKTNIDYAVASALYWWKNLSARGGNVNRYTTGVTKEDVYNVSWCVNGIKKQDEPFMPNHIKEANGLKDRWEKFEKIAKYLGVIR